MAPQHPGSVALLRATTFRISSTPTNQLPHVAPQVAAAIWNCRDLLSTPTEAKQNSETSIVIHRFKTQLSTLLQDRSIEGRWAAVVLVKSTIEAGAIEVLSKSNAWVKNLLGILKRPDPPTTRILTVLTLTRIFMLTWDYSNLIREITTPTLTAFVPTCIANIENKRCSASELETVLEAFGVLLPHHPTIFRTNESRLRAYLTKVLSSNSGYHDSTLHYSHKCRDAAGRLLAQLPTCAPKQGSSEKWVDSLKAVTSTAHATCDRIFRAVDEDWQSVAGVGRANRALGYGGEVESESDDEAGLKPWKGIYAGSQRLISLLQVIKSHLATATPSTVSVRIGVITDLLTRLFATTQPHSGNQDFIKFNNQVSKDEREAMFAVLPDIHVAAMEVCETMIQRFGNEMLAMAQLLVEQVSSVFKAERKTAQVHVATYRLLNRAIDIVGPSMSRGDVLELAAVMEACCEDILPNETAPSATPNNAGIKQQLGLSGSKTTQSHLTANTEVRQAAVKLLCTALDRLEAVSLPPKLRAQIDRVAVLARNDEVLLSSVMNPHRKANEARIQPSLLPILAREFGGQPQVEALLRPRLPPVRARATTQFEENDEVEEGGAMEEDVEDAAGENISEPIAAISEVVQDEQIAMSQQAGSSDPMGSHSSKRQASPEADSSLSSKRLRATPVAESSMPEAASVLPGPPPGIAQNELPTVTLLAPNEQTVTAFQSAIVQPDTVASDAGNKPAGVADTEGDDSDFEMPPLTMEPDTDPDDEDDE